MSKVLAITFYFLGDLVSRLPYFPFSYDLYSWFMNKSLEYDEKCGFQIWKKPTE